MASELQVNPFSCFNSTVFVNFLWLCFHMSFFFSFNVSRSVKRASSNFCTNMVNCLFLFIPFYYDHWKSDFTFWVKVKKMLWSFRRNQNIPLVIDNWHSQEAMLKIWKKITNQLLCSAWIVYSCCCCDWWCFRQSIDLYSSVPSPNIGYLGTPSLSRLSSSFLSTSLTRRHTPEALPSVAKPLIQDTEDEQHQRRSSHTLLPPLPSRRSSLIKKDSKVAHLEVPSRHCSFGQAMLNGILFNLWAFYTFHLIYGHNSIIRKKMFNLIFEVNK